MHDNLNPGYESEQCVRVSYVHNIVASKCAGSSCCSLFVFGLRSQGPASSVTDTWSSLTCLRLWEIYGSLLGLVSREFQLCVLSCLPHQFINTSNWPFHTSSFFQVCWSSVYVSVCVCRASPSEAGADAYTICIHTHFLTSVQCVSHVTPEFASSRDYTTHYS